jgi:putative oxidoreductase
MSDTKMRDGGLLLLRMLGAMFATHGFDKLFADGFGENVPVGAVAGHGLPLPVALAWAAAITEFLGGILIAIGLYTRPAAVLAAVTMSVAAFVIHGADGFGKMELALVYLIGFGTLAVLGPGRWSGDGAWRGKP